MIETYHSGAYWGPRRETAGECARRAEAFLGAMAHLDPTFRHWFKAGRSRKDALKHRLETDRASLEEELRRSQDRSFEDLGFSFGGWNGETDEEAAAFTVRCGGWFERGPNSCTFQLPHQGPAAERVLTAPVQTGLVRAMATCWEPDWAECLSRLHMDRLPKAHRPSVRVGWMVYLSRRLGPVPPLPASVRIEPVEGLGTLLLLTPERFTVGNPAHLALAERVREVLDHAGLLTPPLASGAPA